MKLLEIFTIKYIFSSIFNRVASSNVCYLWKFCNKTTFYYVVLLYKKSIVCLQNISKYTIIDKCFTQFMFIDLLLFCYGFLYYVVTCD